MTRRDLMTWAFGLIIAGGILLLVSSIRMLVDVNDFRKVDAFFPGEPFAEVAERAMLYALLGTAAGIALLLIAVKVHAQPANTQTWAIAAIVAGAVGLLAATLGPVVAIAGGVVALTAAMRT